jgi:hypothetical protein
VADKKHCNIHNIWQTGKDKKDRQRQDKPDKKDGPVKEMPKKTKDR